MNKKPKNKKSIFDDKRITLIVSLLLAVFAWIVVAGFIMPSDSRQIRNIPIDYAYNEQLYQNRGLQIVNTPTELYADVQVVGDSDQLGGLAYTSVMVYPDYTNVTQAGQQEVPLRYVKVSSATFDITAVSVRGGGHSLDGNAKDTVTLTFENVDSKTFDVTYKADNVTAASGYYKDAVTGTPKTVTIRGPESRLAQVYQVVAEVTDAEEREENIKYQGVQLALLDEHGQVLDPDALGLTLSETEADVDVVINMMQTINLTATFTGMPNGFDTEWFNERVHLSDDSIEVVGQAAAFDNLEDPYSIATFDISQLGKQWESDPITVELPEGSGLEIIDQLRYVTVSFDTTDMVEKTFELSTDNFQIYNEPRNAEISPMVDTISVKLIGPEDQINALLPENIMVQIDAFSISSSAVGSQMSIPARIVIPSADRCFAIGSYSVICEIQTGG